MTSQWTVDLRHVDLTPEAYFDFNDCREYRDGQTLSRLYLGYGGSGICVLIFGNLD